MTSPLAAKLQSRLAHLGHALLPGPRILCYHRVAAVAPDPQLLAVSPGHFAEHLAVLRAHAHPMPLSAMVRALQEGTLPRRAVAVTFDDGYVDNLYQARLRLQQYDVPATVFVASGHIGSGEEFWWDELERLLLQPGTLPEALRLPLPEGELAWRLDAAAEYRPADAARHAGWTVRARRDPTPRHALYRRLCARLRSLPAAACRDAIGQLRAWAGARARARSSHRMLTHRELHLLVKNEQIEIGAHTVSHAMLAALTPGEQQREIAEGRRRLEALTGRPVTTFAYPYGAPSSYTSDTVRLVREDGLCCACTTLPGRVIRQCDPWQLPRVLVRNWDGDRFARQLAALLQG